MSDAPQIDPNAAERSDDPLEAVRPLGAAKIAPAHAIAGVALTLAMKYHDINTIRDGALYQQYKLEGKNTMPLHLDMVFETAMRIEAHLLGASERIAKMVVDAIEMMPEDQPAEGSEPSTPASE